MLRPRTHLRVTRSLQVGVLPNELFATLVYLTAAKSGQFNQSTLDLVDTTVEVAWSACDPHSAEAAHIGTQLEVTIDSFALQLNNLGATLAGYSNTISLDAEPLPHLTACGFD
jgi:hypothetical protein